MAMATPSLFASPEASQPHLPSPAAPAGLSGRAAWRALGERAGARVAGLTTKRLDSPNKYGKGSVFYERPSPLERPDLSQQRTTRPEPKPCHDMNFPPKWGFHLHRGASRERDAASGSMRSSSSTTRQKFESISSLQAFGIAPGIDSSFRRAAGHHSPSHVDREQMQREGREASIAGVQSPRSERMDMFRAGVAHIDDNHKRAGGMCSPQKPGYIEALSRSPSSRIQHRMRCARESVSDITVATHLGTGTHSPRMDDNPRLKSIGSMAQPCRAEDGPLGAHNLLKAESVIRTTNYKPWWGDKKEEKEKKEGCEAPSARRSASHSKDGRASIGGISKPSPRQTPWRSSSARRTADLDSRLQVKTQEKKQADKPMTVEAGSGTLRKSRSSSAIVYRDGNKKLAGNVLTELHSSRGLGKVKSASSRASSLGHATGHMPSAEPGPEPTPLDSPHTRVRFLMKGSEPCSEPSPHQFKHHSGDAGSASSASSADGSVNTRPMRKSSYESEPGREPSPLRVCEQPSSAWLDNAVFTPLSPAQTFSPSETSTERIVRHVLTERSPTQSPRQEHRNVKETCNEGHTCDPVIRTEVVQEMRQWQILERVLFVQEQLLEEELAKLGPKGAVHDDIVGKWSYDTYGLSGMYVIRRTSGKLFFEEGEDNDFRFGELVANGDWLVAALKYTSGEPQGTLRLRLENNVVTSQFKEPGTHNWGARIGALKIPQAALQPEEWERLL